MKADNTGTEPGIP